LRTESEKEELRAVGRKWVDKLIAANKHIRTRTWGEWGLTRTVQTMSLYYQQNFRNVYEALTYDAEAFCLIHYECVRLWEVFKIRKFWELGDSKEKLPSKLGAGFRDVIDEEKKNFLCKERAGAFGE
jgi:hypothetical protein